MPDTEIKRLWIGVIDKEGRPIGQSDMRGIGMVTYYREKPG